MNKKEKFALFLGMLSGDGCLSIKHNGEGYRDYPIDFCNTDREIVGLFDNLFFQLFKVRGSIYTRKRKGRKEIWNFQKHSVEIVTRLKAIGFPEGVKKDVLKVPNLIFEGSENEKRCFIWGLLITDGSLKKNRGIMFHLGSKRFLEDLSKLIKSITGRAPAVKEYSQKNKYKSYQLYLNKEERQILLRPDGTMVLRRS